MEIVENEELVRVGKYIVGTIHITSWFESFEV